MDTQIVFVYCLCDDLLKALQHGEDPQCRVSDAEILTVALVAALYFGGHFQRANEFLHEQGYLPRRLSASRFSRRIHRCAPFVLPLFHGLAGLGHQLNPESVYIIDSFPLAVCDNIRIPRCRRYRGEEWRGYQGQQAPLFLRPENSPAGHRARTTRGILPDPRRRQRHQGAQAIRL